jgi:HlyD family secretion protein
MKNPLLKKIFLTLLALILLGGFGWVVTKSGPLAPVQVTVAPVTRQAIEASVFGIGTVEARYTYRLGPTAAGRVKRVLADVGEMVSAGQTLAEMEAIDLDSRIQAAQAQLKLASSENQRTASLANRALLSTSAAEARQQDAAVAAANLQALQQQRSNLSLTAPVAGIITTRDAEPGTTLVAGQPVLTLADTQSYWVKARIDQSLALGLQVGQTASITLRSAPQQPLVGKLVRIEPLSDSITEERIVGIAFTPPPASLSLGELAEVTLQTGQKADALVISNAAPQHYDGQTGVWKLNGDNTLQFTAIQTGIQSLDGQLEVLGGLQADDEIVVYTSKALTPTSKIKVVEQLAGSKP